MVAQVGAKFGGDRSGDFHGGKLYGALPERVVRER